MTEHEQKDLRARLAVKVREISESPPVQALFAEVIAAGMPLASEAAANAWRCLMTDHMVGWADGLVSIAKTMREIQS